METRSSVRQRQHLEQLRRADGVLSQLPWLPEALQLHVLDALVPLMEPEPPTTGLYPIAAAGLRKAQRLVELMLVSKAWRAHLLPHPLMLRSLRLHRLLLLSFVHDWVHFIVDKKKRATKSRRLPATIALPFPLALPCPPACGVGTSAAAAQREPPASADEQREPGAPGSSTVGKDDSKQHHAPSRCQEQLQLEVLSRHKGHKGAGVSLGLPTTACVLCCRSLHALQAPATTLMALASELEVLDQQHLVSIVLQVHCGTVAPAGTHPPPPPPPPQHGSIAQGSSTGPDGGAGSGSNRAVAALDGAYAGLSAVERARRLAALAVSRHLAVEVGKGAQGEVVLWLIPTCSRINRRVPYNAQDPVGHLELL